MNPIHDIFGLRHADAVAFAVTETDAQAGRIVGTACHFGRVNANGWALAHGALDRWLADFQRAGRKLPMLWSHIPEEQIGSFDSAQIEGDRLVLSGRLNLKVNRAKEVRELILAGDSTGLSIGASVEHDDMDRTRNGLTFRKARLVECSAVAMPADDNARISIAASVSTRTEFERFLRKQGFARAAASALAAKGWAGLAKSEASENTETAKALLDRIVAATGEMKKLRRD